MDRYGKMQVLKLELRQDGKQKNTFASCRCECGNEKEVRLKHLKAGKIVSCGCNKAEKAKATCIKKNTIHNNSKTKLYSIWIGIKGRCNYPSSLHYKNYGGRGIKLCEEWLIFDNFQKWAMSTGHKPELVLDRINPNGNYEPSNCRWVTIKQNCNNKRNNVRYECWGESKTIPEWIEDNRCRCKNQTTLFYRIRKLNWNIERAIKTPSLRKTQSELELEMGEKS